MARPEIIEKKHVFFGGVEPRRWDGREAEGSAELNGYIRGLSLQFVLRSDQTPAPWNIIWKTSVVTGMGANTTLSEHTVRFFDLFDAQQCQNH